MVHKLPCMVSLFELGICRISLPPRGNKEALRNSRSCHARSCLVLRRDLVLTCNDGVETLSEISCSNLILLLILCLNQLATTQIQGSRICRREGIQHSFAPELSVGMETNCCGPRSQKSSLRSENITERWPARSNDVR